MSTFFYSNEVVETPIKTSLTRNSSNLSNVDENVPYVSKISGLGGVEMQDHAAQPHQRTKPSMKRMASSSTISFENAAKKFEEKFFDLSEKDQTPRPSRTIFSKTVDHIIQNSVSGEGKNKSTAPASPSNDIKSPARQKSNREQELFCAEVSPKTRTAKYRFLLLGGKNTLYSYRISTKITRGSIQESTGFNLEQVVAVVDPNKQELRGFSADSSEPYTVTAITFVGFVAYFATNDRRLLKVRLSSGAGGSNSRISPEVIKGNRSNKEEMIVDCLAVDTEETIIVSTSMADKTARVFFLGQEEEEEEFPEFGENGRMHHVSRTCAITPDDSKLLLGGGAGRSGLVRVFDVKNKFKLLGELKEGKVGNADVSCLKFAKNGAKLIVGSLDRTIKILDISEPKVGDWTHAMTLAGHLSSVKVT